MEIKEGKKGKKEGNEKQHKIQKKMVLSQVLLALYQLSFISNSLQKPCFPDCVFPLKQIFKKEKKGGGEVDRNNEGPTS